VKIKNILFLLILLVFIFSMPVSLKAENGDETFYGTFMFGYRTVDTSGADFKYKEDINLDDGLRLFNFSLHYTPEQGLKKLLDRIDININNFGGDPFETFRLSIQKYGSYKFQYNRRKAAYFYHDLYQPGEGQFYDLHAFDFDRIMDSGLLNIQLGNNLDLYLNFDRFVKKGNRTNTFDINRIEFEFEKPIEEESKEAVLGVSLHFNRYSILFEEKIQDYESSNSLFLPGYADGGAFARYPSSLNYFYLNQPYDFKAYTHTFKFKARPFDNLVLAGSTQIINLDMDLTYSESGDGVDYLGRFFTYSSSGQGSFERKIRLYDFDINYLLFNKLAVVGAVRYSNFDQDGQLSIDGDKESATLKYDTIDIESGLQYQFSSRLGVTLGYRYEARELEGVETVTYEEKTERHGFFGNLKADLAQAFRLTLDYQYGSYNDPFTLISPTSLNRIRATTKLKINQFSASGSYLWSKSKSEIYENLWESSKNQIGLRAGYQAEKLKIMAGYSLIDIEHKGSQLVFYPPSWSGPAGTFLWDIFYEGKSNLLDGSFSFNPSQKWKIGLYANSYSNSGFWEISRTILKGYLDYTFDNGFITQLGYRYVDFKEKSSGDNDYKANIVEISFGYRWE